MKTQLLRLIVGIVALWAAATAHAQTTAGSGTVIVIANAANTSSFGNEISVYNPSLTSSITLDVLFYEATSSSSPGLHTCSQLTLPPNAALNFQLVTQCSMDTSNHHGMLILQDSATPKVNFFYAHGRLQTPFAIGYSVEGFPIGNFSGSQSSVLGLKRTSTGNLYASNCFIGALGETLHYKIQLFDGATSAQIGSDVTGTLSPFQMTRYLNILAVAGAPAGDYNNVRALFTNTADGAAMVAYCTVQESNHLNSDFRIARSKDALDQRQKRLVCYASADCQNADSVNPTQITSTSTKNIHWLFLTPPDFVECHLVSPSLGDLEMRLRVPGDVFTSPVFVPSPPFDADPPYSAGGSTKTSFYIFTGYRNAVNAGTVTRWFIDVSFNETTGVSGDLPVNYGIICNSGNGVSVPWFRATAADDF
jgi:hypothetical protein